MAKGNKPNRSGVPLGVTYVDEDVRAAMDAYIAEHNGQLAETQDHPASQRSTVEAALKRFLKEKGFWPWPKKETGS